MTYFIDFLQRAIFIQATIIIHTVTTYFKNVSVNGWSSSLSTEIGIWIGDNFPNIYLVQKHSPSPSSLFISRDTKKWMQTLRGLNWSFKMLNQK